MLSSVVKFEIARTTDAKAIGIMSCDLIEKGLGWSWTPARVAQNIESRDTVVLVARAKERLIGFGIMYFGDESAHLNLLGVLPAFQKIGVGRGIMEWLEASARTAGIGTVFLEVRAKNKAARAFYKKMGYEEFAYLSHYYNGTEAAVRMVRDLRVRELN